MANHLAVAAATEALRLRLLAAISTDVTGVDVVTRRPDTADSQAASIVTVFLYRVTPNAALRNSDLPTRGADGAVVRRPRVALTLHYLLSFSGDEEQAVPQRMLGRSMTSLHQAPTLSRSELQAAGQGSAWLAASDVHHEVETITLSLGDLTLDDLSKVWSVFFQVPYRLSVEYEASVVLLEADVAAREPLPVQDRGVHALAVPQPVVDHVRAADGGDVVGGVPLLLELVGRNLRGPLTAVRFDGGPLVPVVSATATRVVVAADDLAAGPHGVQVVHQVPLGDPPVPHGAAESASAAFLLRPAVRVELVPEAAPVPDPARAVVVLTVAPPLRAGQRVGLLLNEHVVPAPADRPLRFVRLEPQAPPATGDTTVRFPRGTVPAGDYLVRLQVDGAVSPLTFPRGDDTDPPRPRVALP